MSRLLRLLLCLGVALVVGACATAKEDARFKAEQAADSHTGAGLYLLGSGELEEARRRLERALEIDPEHPQAMAGMGLVAEGVGELERAVDYHSQAAELAKRHSAASLGPILNNLGRALCRLQRVDAAIDILNQAARVDGYGARHIPLTNAARCALDADRLEQARSLVEAALVRQGGFAPALLVRAEVDYRQGDYASAAGDLAKVREFHRSPRTLFYSVRAAEKLGQEGAAAGFAEELRDNFPRSEYVRRLDADEGGTP